MKFIATSDFMKFNTAIIVAEKDGVFYANVNGGANKRALPKIKATL